jgi:DNA-binding response OmpR family regulator
VTASNHPPNRPRALVLEADAASAGALVAALDSAGFQTQLAARPNTANALLQVADQEHEPFRLLVVSRMVGGICGLSLGTALRARASTPPVFLLSSGPFGAPEVNELERADCRGVILKPLETAQFLALVSEALPAGPTPSLQDRRVAL